MDYFQKIEALTNAAKADPRTVHELITQFLTEPDEDQSQELLCILLFRGTKDVFDAASDLCVSACPQERTLGAHILGQLGSPERSFPDQSVKILPTMLETDVDAITSICEWNSAGILSKLPNKWPTLGCSPS